MFLPTALLSLLSFTTVLNLLHCFLLGMAETRSNTTLYVGGRTGERAGDCRVVSINPKCRSLREWGKWALLEDALTALQSSGWCTPVHSTLTPSLGNKNLALLDSPRSSFSQKTPVRRSQLPLQAPSAALQPNTCPWLCHMPKLCPKCLNSQSGASFNAFVSFSLSLQWSPIERSLAVVPTTSQRSLCKNSHLKTSKEKSLFLLKTKKNYLRVLFR